jgi:hypothetical protein
MKNTAEPTFVARILTTTSEVFVERQPGVFLFFVALLYRTHQSSAYDEDYRARPQYHPEEADAR